MSKVLLGGIVGGGIVFLWGAFAHMVLPLGEAGFKSLPAEEVLVPAMRTSMREPGMYFFPGADMDKEMTPAEEEEYNHKVTTGPTGLVVYRVHGEVMGPRMLVTQALSDVAAALIVAFVLMHVAGTYGYGRRVIIATLLGAFAWVTVNVPYWNWYGFDADFTRAALIESVVGWLLAGLFLGRVCRSCEA